VILAGEDDYWDGLVAWVKGSLLSRGKIGPEDLPLLQRARTPDEVLALVATEPARLRATSSPAASTSFPAAAGRPPS
jgi:hypothetical protein